MGTGVRSSYYCLSHSLWARGMRRTKPSIRSMDTSSYNLIQLFSGKRKQTCLLQNFSFFVQFKIQLHAIEFLSARTTTSFPFKYLLHNHVFTDNKLFTFLELIRDTDDFRHLDGRVQKNIDAFKWLAERTNEQMG